MRDYYLMCISDIHCVKIVQRMSVEKYEKLKFCIFFQIFFWIILIDFYDNVISKEMCL